MMIDRLRRLDPALLVLLVGVLVRVDTVLRFDPALGYDAPDHIKVMDLYASGTIPRIETNWEAQHPPLFYLLALLLKLVGLGPRGGQLVSLAAGVVRLFVADHLFGKLAPTSPRHTRLVANTLHAFLPVAIRMDSFFNPESLGAAMSLSAVALALAGRPVLTGLVLGGALLSKSSAVAAVPAVGLALAFGTGGLHLPRLAELKRLAIAYALGAGILMIWAWPNVRAYHTPYPPAQLVHYGDPIWQLPLAERHQKDYYLPRFAKRVLWYPFYEADISMPSTFMVDAWGDYYNFSNRGILHGASREQAANGRRLGATRLAIHVFLAQLALPLTAALFAGLLGFAWRVRRRETTREELILAVHALGYLTIMVVYAVWHPVETDGPVKACYGLGASVMLAYWTARTLARLTEVRFVRLLVPALLVAVAGAVLAIRVTW